MHVFIGEKKLNRTRMFTVELIQFQFTGHRFLLYIFDNFVAFPCRSRGSWYLSKHCSPDYACPRNDLDGVFARRVRT